MLLDVTADKIDTLRAAAAIMWPRFGEWAYETWLSHNYAYFDGELETCGIIWGLTPHGKCMGRFSGVITLHSSLIESHGNPWGARAWLGEQWASDVLLHEMVHQAIHQRTGGNGAVLKSDSSHSNPHWAAEVDRISPLIGLDVRAMAIRQRRINRTLTRTPDAGYMTLKQLSEWPHSVRPQGYYRNT